jgi:hypothetical protein
MPRTPQRAGWLRFPAPSLLAFTLLLGILPWVEVGCEGKPEDFKALNEPNPATGKRIFSHPVGQNGKFAIATQNGYQAIWAGSSPSSEIKDLQRETEKQAEEFAKNMGGNVKVEKTKKKEKDPNEPDPAPLLAVFFVLVLAAVVVGFAMPPGHWRSLVFLGTLGSAIAIFGIQVALGLPMKNKAEEKPKDKGGNPAVGGLDFGKMELNGPKPYCHYTMWYYLNWPFLLLPLGLVGVEEVIGLATGGPKKKRRRFEEEDEDEDRPRRRRRREEEDEDEEEVPRRRRRTSDHEDEGIQDAPRKKRRYHDEDEDDEDEEEQPRKRRR